MKPSNSFKVTKALQDSEIYWLCDTCGKLINRYYSAYFIDPLPRQFGNRYWVCSEECINMFILSRL
jgi:hypothetical protein